MKETYRSGHPRLEQPEYPKIPEIFNSKFDGNETFTCFSKFPPEIRRRIWEAALSCERYLFIRLEDRIGPNNYPEELLPLAFEGRFIVNACHQEYYHVLLTVNSESRALALRWYRCHIPCIVDVPEVLESTMGKRIERAKTYDIKFGIMYFNPEWDILEIDHSHCDGPFAYAALIYALKHDYDHRGRGLLNLSVNGKGVGFRLTCLLPTSRLPQLHSDAMIEMLKNVRQVIFSGKFVAYDQIFINNENKQKDLDLDDPISAQASGFDRRPYSYETDELDADCYEMMQCYAYEWSDFLSGWGISLNDLRTEFYYRYIQKPLDDSKAIYSRRDAEEDWMLYCEKNNWVQKQSLLAIFGFLLYEMNLPELLMRKELCDMDKNLGVTLALSILPNCKPIRLPLTAVMPRN